MKCETRVLLGVGAGYALGRSHKMRWALMLAAAGATGRLPGMPGELLERGTKVLGSSPELSKLTETARDRLLESAKAAIMATLNSQIDFLSQRLQERAEPLGQPSRPSGTAEEEEEAEQPRGRARPEDQEDQEEDEEEPEPLRRRPAGVATARSGSPIRRMRR